MCVCVRARVCLCLYAVRLFAVRNDLASVVKEFGLLDAKVDLLSDAAGCFGLSKEK